MKRDGILISVAKELIASASEVAAYPDSDDDDSDDDEDARRANRSFSDNDRKLKGKRIFNTYSENDGNVLPNF